jgi:isochorismate synthase
MSDFYSKIKKQKEDNLPFVLYCKPNSDSVIGLLQSNDVLYTVVDFSESGFVFASFDGNQKYYIPEKDSDTIHFVIEKEIKSETEMEISVPNSESKVFFETLVKNGIQAIEKKQFKKVVLSRKETVTLTEFDLIITFKKLVQLYPVAFVYCFFHPKVGLWIGATPEQLVKVDGGIFKTMALAGTQKNTDKEEVKWHDKEKEEQQFVTDYIVSELNKVSDDLLVSKPHSVKAGSIWHIKTDISGQLNSTTNLEEVIRLLHPTPAVCGLPKQESKDFIVENEDYDRTFYTGFLGELNTSSATDKRSSDLFVNLRCMSIDEDFDSAQANLYMGCGITKDSIPEKEWEESVNKSMTMKKVLI